MNNPPEDLLELGRIAEPYGLKGWVNVLPDTPEAPVLLKVKTWWISRLDSSSTTKAVAPISVKTTSQGASVPSGLVFEPFRVLAVKPHAGHLVAHLEGIEQRELALQFKGRRIYVPRSRFPAAAEGEFYWIDLVGCAVYNLQNVLLGQVHEVMDHGAHAILVVRSEARQDDHLIPFVQAYVPVVDMAARRIEVDWQDDY